MFTNAPRQPVWPLPSLTGRLPIALTTDPKTAGLELAYADMVVPDMTPAFAVGDGVITYAGKQLHGYAVVIDHKNGWASYYANLEHMFALPTNRGARARVERVKTSDVIGFVGAAMPDAPRCLHFELWRLGPHGHYEPTDALAIMRSWLIVPWRNERVSVSRMQATA